MARRLDGTTGDILRCGVVRAALPCTFLTWVNPSSAATNQIVLAMSHADTGKYTGHYLQVQAGGSLGLATVLADDWGGGAYATAAGVWQVGRWQMVGWSMAADGSATIYARNGVASASRGPGGPSVAGSLTATGIGGYPRYASVIQPAGGLYAHAAIWSAALTAAEVAAMASGASPLLIRPASLVAYWPLRGLACDRPEPGLVRNLGLTVVGTAWSPDPPGVPPAPLFGPQDGSPVAAVGRARIPTVIHHTRRKRGA
jgi:hypothetical protein